MKEETFEKRKRQMRFMVYVLVGWIIGTSIYAIITGDFLSTTIVNFIGVGVSIVCIFYIRRLSQIKKTLGES